MRSATRSLALRARGFSASSSGPGVTGLRVMSFSLGFFPHTHTGNWGGQVQPVASSRRVCLTIRSPCLGTVNTARRPPGYRPPAAAASWGARASSSPFTAMRRA